MVKIIGETEKEEIFSEFLELVTENEGKNVYDDFKLILQKIAYNQNVKVDHILQIISQLGEKKYKGQEKDINLEQEKYSQFGAPDENQKKMIDEMNEGFKQKMIDCGLKYDNTPGEETITVNINGEELVFDKVQPIQDIVEPTEGDNYWQASIDEINEIGGHKGIENEDTFKKLCELFKGKYELLGLDNKFYWGPEYTEGAHANTTACVGYITFGHVHHDGKSHSGIRTICIRN